MIVEINKLTHDVPSDGGSKELRTQCSGLSISFVLISAVALKTTSTHTHTHIVSANIVAHHGELGSKPAGKAIALVT